MDPNFKPRIDWCRQASPSVTAVPEQLGSDSRSPGARVHAAAADAVAVAEWRSGGSWRGGRGGRGGLGRDEPPTWRRPERGERS